MAARKQDTFLSYVTCLYFLVLKYQSSIIKDTLYNYKGKTNAKQELSLNVLV